MLWVIMLLNVKFSQKFVSLRNVTTLKTVIFSFVSIDTCFLSYNFSRSYTKLHEIFLAIDATFSFYSYYRHLTLKTLN